MKNVFNIGVMLALLLTLTACGGSMGSDPASTSGTTTPTASAQPSAASGSLAALMGATTPGTLSATGSGALTYAISTPAQNGAVTITNAATGAFTYTSYPNFSGRDSFQFTVADSSGTSQPATETVNVTSGALGAEQAVANIGVSTDWVCYWCTGQPYVNVVRESSAFDDPTTGYPLIEEGKLDQNGWPEADFRWMVLCCVNADGSAGDPGPQSPLIGKYHLSFNGIAKIWDDGGTVEDQQYDQATNTTTATLDQTPLNSDGTGFDMLLGFSNTQRTATSATGTGVTNIQIIRPQFAPNGTKWWDSPSQEFTDPFLASFKGFSTIRYINWTKVIGSPEINWADRTPGNWPVAGHQIEAAPSAASYLSAPASTCTQYCDWYGTGESWESALDVANATHTDMWINVPVMATDAYVTSLAQLIKANLDPGLHVYVEWSDEIWNWGNPYWTETSYAVNHVKALLATNPVEAAKYNANCASWASFECYVAERVMQFGNDFAAVYGQPAITATIRPVLCTQVVQPVFMMEALRFIAASYGPPANYFYGTCGAPYWSAPASASALPSGSTIAAAVAAIGQGISATTGNLQADAAIDLYYGLHNLTYEGGPDSTSVTVTGDTSAEQSAFTRSLITAPGMKQQVMQGLSAAFASGVDMYMYYEVAGPDNFGATIDPADLAPPRLLGLQALAGQMVTRNAGTPVPGNVPAMSVAFGVMPDGTARPMFETTGWYSSAASGSNPASENFNGNGPAGSGLVYLVDAAAGGSYSVVPLMNNNASTPAASIECDVDGKPIGTFTVPATPAGATVAVNSLTVTLAVGLHLIAIKNTANPPSSGFGIYGLNVTSN